MAYEINQDVLKKFLSYNPLTGRFFKNEEIGSRGRKIGGYELGAKNTQGYIVIGIYKRKMYAHRLAWLYMHGKWPEHHIDHINGDKGDNRLENLREANNSENMQNIKGPRIDNKFGLLGVCFDKEKQKYLAQIRLNGKNKYLGRYDTAEQAHNAYMRAKHNLHQFNTI